MSPQRLVARISRRIIPHTRLHCRLHPSTSPRLPVHALRSTDRVPSEHCRPGIRSCRPSSSRTRVGPPAPAPARAGQVCTLAQRGIWHRGAQAAHISALGAQTSSGSASFTRFVCPLVWTLQAEYYNSVRALWNWVTKYTCKLEVMPPGRRSLVFTAAWGRKQS